MDLKRCRLTEKQQDRLAEFFVAGVTARTAADLLGVNRKTAAYFYHRLRQIIAQEVDRGSPLAGQIEVDESYFGGHRKGKRGRGAAGKVPVFGLLKRGGHVYTVMIPSTKSAVLMDIIREKIQPDSVIYTDSLSAYDVLDVSEFYHHRINHSEQFVEPGKVHINGNLISRTAPKLLLCWAWAWALSPTQPMARHNKSFRTFLFTKSSTSFPASPPLNRSAWPENRTIARARSWRS
jgi:transposase